MRAILLFLLLSVASYGQYLPVDGVRQPIKGVNLPWFDGAYGHCYGPLPAEPTWGWSYERGKAEERFASMSALHVNVMRVWVFEDYEGIDFEDGRPVGINPTFLRNLQEAISIADSKGINSYLCLFNHVNHPKYLNLYKDSKFRKALLNNVVVPFTKAMKDNPGVFAFDVMNEPKLGSNMGPSWAATRTFLRDCTTLIHRHDPKRLVSTGSDLGIAEGHYSGLGFDFYDLHMYSNNEGLPSVQSLRQKMARLGAGRKDLNMPILVGECGPDLKRTDFEIQRQAVARFLRTGRDGGYAGVLVWCYSHPNAKTEEDWAGLVKGNGDPGLRPAGVVLKDFRW